MGMYFTGEQMQQFWQTLENQTSSVINSCLEKMRVDARKIKAAIEGESPDDAS